MQKEMREGRNPRTYEDRPEVCACAVHWHTEVDRTSQEVSEAWKHIWTARDIVEEDLAERRIQTKMMRVRKADDEEAKKEKDDGRYTKAKGFLVEKEDPEKSSADEKEEE